MFERKLAKRVQLRAVCLLGWKQVGDGGTNLAVEALTDRVRSIAELGNRQYVMFAQQRFRSDVRHGDEVPCRQSCRPHETFFFKDVVAIVLVDNKIRRLEVQTVEELVPAMIEANDGGDQVLADRQSSPNRGGSLGPLRALGMG